MLKLNSFVLCFLILSVGSFFNNVKYKIKKNNPKKISLASNSSLKGYGYWLNGRDMKVVNLNDLSKKGTTDIFLNFYSITLHGQKEVVSWRPTVYHAAAVATSATLLPSRRDHLPELGEKILRIVRTGTGFGMVLHGIRGKRLVADALDRAVIEVDVRHFQAIRQ